MELNNTQLLKGLMWGIILSIPLWISIMGWVRILLS